MDPSRHAPRVAAAIAAAAAGFALFGWLGRRPPGIHVDAAANAWNAICLLRNGTDWWGDPWPVFYTRAFGENRSTLYLYLALPFQVAGVSVASALLPTATAGFACLVFIRRLGARLFDSLAGWVAAGVLLTSPWFVFLSRSGHEAGVVPLLVVLAWTTWAWAGLPFGAGEDGGPRPWRAFVAGVVTGCVCYGYPAVRASLPSFLAIAAALEARSWADWWRDRAGRRAVLGFAAGLGATLGPLVWVHLTDPAINARALDVMLWDPADPFPLRAARVATRWAGHFDPRFLFGSGDPWYWNRIDGWPPLLWFVAPLAAAGLVRIARTLRSSAASRALVAALVAYPLGDAFTGHPGMHALRSAAGLPAIALLAGLGATEGAGLLRRAGRSVRTAAASVFGALALVAAVSFFHGYISDYARRPEVYERFNADLLDAAGWLAPRLDEVDAVFVTSRNPGAAGQGFVVLLVGLDFPVDRWFEDGSRFETVGGREFGAGFGKVAFLGSTRARDLLSKAAGGASIWIVRPGEPAPGERVHEIRGPDGATALAIYAQGQAVPFRSFSDVSAP